ncbi:hypothetical protein BVRB_021230, partial [Beta vulgaris subsp. vulgaris]
ETQRREMMKQLESLNLSKKGLISANEEMKALLDSIPAHLERIMKAALPLRKHMTLPTTVILPDSKDNLIDVRIEICSDPLEVLSGDTEFKLHPYSVFVTIKEPNISAGLDLVFSALYPGPIIFVKGGSNILTDLYSEDDGTTFPNSMQHVVEIATNIKYLLLECSI